MADYGTDAGFLAYWLARGEGDLTVIYDGAGEIAAARLVASEAIDGRYGAQFGGLKVGMRAQVREWPRNGASDRYGYAIASDSVPDEVERATYELTYEQLKSPGSLIVNVKASKYKQASVSGAVSVTYATFGSAFDAQPQYTKVDQILSGILIGAGLGNASSLSGAISRV